MRDANRTMCPHCGSGVPLRPPSLLCALLPLLLATGTDSGTGNMETDFCQVYSYNIKPAGAQVEKEKHLFVCCNNDHEGSCTGLTYQKASRKEAFCSGEEMHKDGSHWTQMETSAFAGFGRFYCGGCCGQHLAVSACKRRLADPKQTICSNWVQCFIHECRNVIAAVLANQPLDCTLPPAPHPKHYIHETRTLPTNVSLQLKTPTPPPSNRSAAACTASRCRAFPVSRRCRIPCCRQYCCLPDGILTEEDEEFLGLSTLQLVGVSIGVLVIMAVIGGILVLVARRCMPVCKALRVSHSDTQVLVIEGPEEPDSDQDPQDFDDPDEGNSV